MAEGKADAELVEPLLSWSIPLEIGSTREFLDHAQDNSAQEELIPREVIAESVRNLRFQAELERPIEIGTYNDLRAFLLRTRFSFQRTTPNWNSRIIAADITLVFEDAPAGGKESTNKNTVQHPAVAAFYPTQFEGEVSEALIGQSSDASIEPGFMGIGFSVGVGQSKQYVQKGRVVVHGVRGGGKHRNSITWSIEQDAVAESGIPRNIELPLVITTRGESRFSAKVTVKAHYGFRRGPLARVLGKNDEPLFFDPMVLESMANMGVEKGPDGKFIVKHSGPFDSVDLRSLSSFK